MGVAPTRLSSLLSGSEAKAAARRAAVPVLTVSRTRWHQTKTAKGIFAKLSKVIEQHADLVETVAQTQPAMTLIEPSDLTGTIDGEPARRSRSVVELAANAHAGRAPLASCLPEIGRYCQSAQKWLPRPVHSDGGRGSDSAGDHSRDGGALASCASGGSAVGQLGLGNRVGPQYPKSSAKATNILRPTQPIVCRVRGHLPGTPVVVRGFVACVCSRCGRPIELARSDARSVEFVTGRANGLHDPVGVAVTAGRVTERVG